MTTQPTGYSITDERLNKCMIHSSSLKYAREYPVYPHPQIASHLADLIAGDHDLTLMDATSREDKYGGPFYEHAHYLASLACAIDAMNKLGEIEHSNDWDWWLGFTLRDGTKMGDGSFVCDPVINDETNEDQIQAQEDAESNHGYCDTFSVPTFDELRPEGTEYSDWFTNMEVVLDVWHSQADPDGKVKHAVAVKDIAIVHFNQR